MRIGKAAERYADAAYIIDQVNGTDINTGEWNPPKAITSATDVIATTSAGRVTRAVRVMSQENPAILPDSETSDELGLKLHALAGCRTVLAETHRGKRKAVAAGVGLVAFLGIGAGVTVGAEKTLEGLCEASRPPAIYVDVTDGTAYEPEEGNCQNQTGAEIIGWPAGAVAGLTTALAVVSSDRVTGNLARTVAKRQQHN